MLVSRWPPLPACALAVYFVKFPLFLGCVLCVVSPLLARGHLCASKPLRLSDALRYSARLMASREAR
jgi:hypothetical protein